MGDIPKQYCYQPSTPDNHTWIPEENQSFGMWKWHVITGKHYRVQRLAKLIFPRKTQQCDDIGILSILLKTTR